MTFTRKYRDLELDRCLMEATIFAKSNSDYCFNRVFRGW